MTHRRMALLAAALVVAGVALLGPRLFASGAQPSAATPPSSAAPADPAPAAIEFAGTDLYTVSTGTLARTIPVTGTLTPVDHTTVRAKVAGEVVEIFVREGETVRRGQLVARLDPADFALRMRERDAQLRSAQAQLEQAQRTFENNRRLLERQFISQNAFDNARSAVDVAAAARDAAEAQSSQARKALADTRMVAPIAGIVAERFAQIGEKVAVDARIVSIVDLSNMEIEAPVPASEIAGVRVGQTVALSIEGVAGRHTGRVARINPGTQAGTRSIPVYIALSFPAGDTRVRAGMFAQGRLVLDERRDVLVVPLAAIRDAGARRFVYLIDDGRLVERDLRTGLRDEAAPAGPGAVGLVEVIDGLQAGDHIVGVNLGTLRTGSRVAIAPVTPGSPPPTPLSQPPRAAPASPPQPTAPPAPRQDR